MAEFVSLRDGIEQLVRPMLYDCLVALVQRNRNFIFLGDQAVTKAALARQASHRFRSWMEHVGDHYIVLKTMTSRDLTVANAELVEQGKAVMSHAQFLIELRDRRGMDDGQVVGDVWNDEELEEVWDDVHK